MDRKELVFAGILTVTGGAGFFYSISLPSHGNIALSPGLFPGVVSLLLFILSLVYFAGLVRKRNVASEDKGTEENSGEERSLVLTLALFPFYLLVLYYLHFAAATFIFLVTAMTFMHGRFRWRIPLISAVSVLTVYYLFEFLLKVKLP